MNKLIFARLNINSIRNKFEVLDTQVNVKIDILMISESKTDENFLTEHFLIQGFSTPYRLDRDSKLSWITLYVMEDKPLTSLL